MCMIWMGLNLDGTGRPEPVTRVGSVVCSEDQRGAQIITIIHNNWFGLMHTTTTLIYFWMWCFILLNWCHSFWGKCAGICRMISINLASLPINKIVAKIDAYFEYYMMNLHCSMARLLKSNSVNCSFIGCDGLSEQLFLQAKGSTQIMIHFLLS